MISLFNSFSLDQHGQKKKVALLVWILIAVFCVVQSLITHRYNNYLIFENVFRNLVNEQSLYGAYPAYHFDVNHYGPFFGLVVMPFAVLPNALGFLLWNLFNVFVLYKAIESIPIKNPLPLYYIAIPCVVSASLSQQFNPAVGALIILSYTLLNHKGGFWSAMFIVLGTYIKLYGIVGLAFFFFVKDKKKYIGYLVFWALALFVLPMLVSSPSFIIGSYREWFYTLIDKNASNIRVSNLDVSIMGFVRGLFVGHQIPNGVFLLFGLLLFGLPYLNFKAFGEKRFQLLILGMTVMFPVLFSTGSEDCTFIIAVPAVGLWYILTPAHAYKKYLMAVVFIASCNLPLLLFPHFSARFPVLFTIMSVPFFIVWLLLIYEACKVRPAQNDGKAKPEGAQPDEFALA